MSVEHSHRPRSVLACRLAAAPLTAALSALLTGLSAGLAGLLFALTAAPHWLLPWSAGALGSVAAKLNQRLIGQLNAAPPAEPTRAPPAAPLPAACPAEMVLIEGGFCPLQPYVCMAYADDAAYRCARYLRGQRCRRPLQPRRYCIDRYEWPNRKGAKPTVFVDWNEAKASCANAGKRLCRRSEWVMACEGPKRLPYPWGYRRQPSRCNIDRDAIPFDVKAMFNPETRDGELARLWQAVPSGSYPDCVSGYGVHDMAGNVDEWTDNQLDDPQTRRPSTLNGGYWGPVRDTCRLTTKKHTEKFRFYQVGFRCCRDPLSGPIPTPKVWHETGDRRPRRNPAPKKTPRAPSRSPMGRERAPPVQLPERRLCSGDLHSRSLEAIRRDPTFRPLAGDRHEARYSTTVQEGHHHLRVQASRGDVLLGGGLPR